MNVFISNSAADVQFAEAIKDALSERLDLPTGSGELRGRSTPELLSASMAIALLLRGSSGGMRPSVMFEMGVAFGAGLPILIVADPDVSIPAVIDHVPVLRRSGDAAADVVEVAKAVAAILNAKPASERARHRSEAATLGAAAADPDVLRATPPRRLQELVEAWFVEHGIGVVPARGGADPGYDFAVVDASGRPSALVEVKKSSPEGRISLDAVMQLSTAMSVAGAMAGVLVGTAPFTRAASALAAASNINALSIGELLRRDARSLVTHSTVTGDEAVARLAPEGVSRPTSR